MRRESQQVKLAGMVPIHYYGCMKLRARMREEGTMSHAETQWECLPLESEP